MMSQAKLLLWYTKTMRYFKKACKSHQIDLKNKQKIKIKTQSEAREPG